jgi:hypothetical protein
MSHFLLLEMQEQIIKSDKHEFDVICALRYWQCDGNVTLVIRVRHLKMERRVRLVTNMHPEPPRKPCSTLRVTATYLSKPPPSNFIENYPCKGGCLRDQVGHWWVGVINLFRKWSPLIFLTHSMTVELFTVIW